MMIKLVIFLFLFSCSVKDKDEKIEERSNIVNVSMKNIYDYDIDMFNVMINYEISNNHFVFTKRDEEFNASLLTTIQFFDSDRDSIVLQESWESEISELYYNDTRSKDRMYSFSKEMKIDSGNYNLKIYVKDQDSNSIYYYSNRLSLDTEDGFGEIVLYKTDSDSINGTSTLEEIKKVLLDEELQIRLDFQYFQDVSEISSLEIKIENFDKRETIELNNLKINEKGFYSSEIQIPDTYYGKVQISLAIKDDRISKTIFIKNKGYNLWSDDINEIVGVMRYILPQSSLKEIKNLEPEEKIQYIADFWSQKDPEPLTEHNELLDEFKARVRYVNMSFSDIGKGWRSDRGRIYIIYGKPNQINRYSSQSDGRYEIWEYPSGSQFTFLDRTGFGNFVLIKQGI